MADREEMRVLFRRIVDAGGDIVDIALAVRQQGWGSGSTQTAAALREEFGSVGIYVAFKVADDKGLVKILKK